MPRALGEAGAGGGAGGAYGAGAGPKAARAKAATQTSGTVVVLSPHARLSQLELRSGAALPGRRVTVSAFSPGSLELRQGLALTERLAVGLRCPSARRGRLDPGERTRSPPDSVSSPAPRARTPVCLPWLRTQMVT